MSWINDADVIFANATCFELPMLESLSENLSKNLKEGGILILTSKSIIDKEGKFTKYGPFKKLMSWGEATLNIFVKAKTQ
jgi:hypothetical protein